MTEGASWGDVWKLDDERKGDVESCPTMQASGELLRGGPLELSGPARIMRVVRHASLSCSNSIGCDDKKLTRSNVQLLSPLWYGM
jgi:hypothetical protein